MEFIDKIRKIIKMRHDDVVVAMTKLQMTLKISAPQIISLERTTVPRKLLAVWRSENINLNAYRITYVRQVVAIRN